MTNKQYDFDKPVNRQGSNSIKWDKRKKIFGNSDAMPLWVADMDFETPDFILHQLRKRLDHPVLGYTFRSDAFNQAFIDWAGKKYQWPIAEEWLSFSPGVVPAVTLIIEAFTQPGDEIITQPPVYFPFYTAINGTNRKLVYNPLKNENGRLAMDFDQLESVITPKTSMIIISNPHNPGGSAWTKEELTTLGNLCEKYQIRVLSDEIHSDLVFSPHQHTPFAKVVPVDKVSSITCMAASKSFNLAGLSTSLVIIPEKELKEKYDKMLHVAHIGMGNIFGAIATETAYREGWEWMQQLLAYLKDNRDFLHTFITDKLSPVRMLIPEATYMAWTDFSGLNMTQDQLNTWLIHEAGVAFNSGTMFGPGGEGYMRINFACPRTMLSQAMTNIEKALHKL